MRWIVRIADGVFLRGGRIEGPLLDPATEQVVEVPDDFNGDPVRHRWDAETGAPRPERPQEEAARREVVHSNEFSGPAADAVRALARATWEQLPEETRPTLGQFGERVKALYLQIRRGGA